ncbi:outer membrane beta-barrel protein [Pedobacter metabolipauper]|nr:outer membrane beta-barrel protein [Pedobacter metabolipauper]
MTTFTFAQKTGSISGVLLDSADHKQTVGYATISVFKVGDSVMTMYKLSDDKGVFKLNNLQTGVRYRIIINAWHYAVIRKEVSLSTATPDLKLDNILMVSKSTDLDEVKIVGERPPIVVRKDTIEFNAASFKTLPAAVLEDLLKKLPGVTLNADGSINVNGKKVNKILVDGKEFFGGDLETATKNLPANIIDKVQVTDDKEARQRDPNMIPADIPQVINLKLKKNIKQGAFGRVYGGGGDNELYEAGGIINVFRETTQLTAFGYRNNVNKSGFNNRDLQGNGSGFATNASLGGGTGLQTSGGAGLNFNVRTKNKVNINGNYLYGMSDNFKEQLAHEDQSIGDDKLLTRNESTNSRQNYTHNIRGAIDFNTDSTLTIYIRPSISIGNSNNFYSANKQLRNKSNELINNADNTALSNDDNISYYNSASLNKVFKKEGRSLYTSLNISKSTNLNNNFNTTESTISVPPSTVSIDQLRDNSIRNFNTELYANYNEPFSKMISMTLRGSMSYVANENALTTFFRNPLDQNYDIAVPNLSETVKQSGIRSSAGGVLIIKLNNNLQLQPGITVNTIDLNNTFSNLQDIRQNYTFLIPELGFRYKSLSIQYRSSFSEPSIQNIQPVSNNTEPLYIDEGSPNLQPTTRHLLSFNLNKYNTKNFFSYSVYGSANIQKNGVVRSKIITPEGIQISTPINIDGITSSYGGVDFRKDYKNAKHQISIIMAMDITHDKGFVMVNNISSNTYRFRYRPQISLTLNLNDKFELNQNYSVSKNSSTYDDPFYPDLKYSTHTSGSSMIIRFPKRIVWDANYNIQLNKQQLAGYDNNIQLLNAGVSVNFLKEDKANLRFSLNDILNAGVRRSISIWENSIYDTQYNNLGTYGLLSITYNIKNFGGNVGGKNKFLGL